MTDRPSLRLDVPREQVLQRAADLIAESWAGFDHARPEQPPVDEAVRQMLQAPLPQGAAAAETVLRDAARILDESIAQPRPRYFAFVGSSGLEIGVVGDALAACYDPNLAVYAGAASDIEEQAVRWVGELVGYPVAAGAFTSGGTISNLTALAAARERAIPGARSAGMAGAAAAIYCSDEAHYSIERAAELLGIGTSGVRAIAIDQHRRMRVDDLAAAIDADLAAGVTPVAVVATAGTTLTGAIDPVGAIADVCAARGVWLHIDGAYGLPAASLAAERGRFAGLERADSASVDAHKWLYLPKACGVVMVRHQLALESTFGHDEAYLPHQDRRRHAVDATLEYSRPFRALKLWLAFRAHGAEAFRQAIARNLAQARLLVDEVARHADLELLTAEPELSIVPFRHLPNGVEPNAHNDRLCAELQRDGRVYVAPAVVDGNVYLRPCLVNYRTSDDDVRALVVVAREVGARLAA